MATDAPGPIPRYVYKILPSPDDAPSPLPHALPLSALDRADGFVHLSAGWRVPLTAHLYFARQSALAVLRLDATAARDEGARLEWADPGCVHMFGRAPGEWARVGAGIAVEARVFGRREGESWEDVLGAEARADGWLRDGEGA